jgi:fibronectin-binding autotransporter adhesin
MLTAIANAGGAITVDSTGKLTLSQAIITGGTVTDHGEIDLTGTGVLKSGTLNTSGQIKVSGLGNTLEGETVTDTGGIEGSRPRRGHPRSADGSAQVR